MKPVIFAMFVIVKCSDKIQRDITVEGIREAKRDVEIGEAEGEIAKAQTLKRTRMMEEEEKDSRPRPAPSSSITVHKHPLQLFPQTWHDIEDLGQGTGTRGVGVT